MISSPAEVCLVRISNDSSLPVEKRYGYTSIVNAATRIVKDEGFGAFYRGVVPFTQRAMLVGACQVASYDQFKYMYAGIIPQAPIG
jgi:hypothetical protein